MPRQYSTTLITLTIALSVIIGVGLLFLMFSKQVEPTCKELGLPTTCTQHSDCGPTGFFGSPYCKDGNVWQGYYQSTCTGTPGTCDSYCSSSQGERRVQECETRCSLGACVN